MRCHVGGEEEPKTLVLICSLFQPTVALWVAGVLLLNVYLPLPIGWLLCMPHTRSPEKASARRDRAVEKRFLVWKPMGATHVLVPSSLATRSRTITRPLDTHKYHCEILGKDVHFDSPAAVQAPTSVAARKQAPQVRVHRAANRAKHVWADLDDDSSLDSSPPSGGGPGMGAGENAGADTHFTETISGQAHSGDPSPPYGGGHAHLCRGLAGVENCNSNKD